MYRARLRPKYTDGQLQQIYPAPHDANNWEDHKIRVRQTVALGKEAKMPFAGGRIADLSCGNGKIATDLAEHFSAEPFLGDLAYAPGMLYHGPIERTIDQLGPNVDLFILSETIEHLDDPDAVLAKIRKRSKQLLLSTPINERGNGNPEHYWGWDQKAVFLMLSMAGWKPTIRTDLCFMSVEFPYDYQIWLCQ